MNSLSSEVRFDNRGLYIKGEYKTLLCASVFYFRIPQELWRDRITRIKNAGYNCADVYFPWNFHEISPGEWSFSGQRDVEAFLKLLAEENMYVIARPGPYICSEWDGGALPAWVLVGDDPIREANPGFLKQVDGWYSKILPFIAKYEIGREGTVIAVQLDNELDFFDCPDSKEYMSQLRELALKHGISVPVFGCAGQGSAERATGFAKGVEIAFNLYPDSRDPAFEELCLAAYSRIKSIDKPLLVTETNRDAFVLRRELACGARLIGAYNQVGGTNFGFTNAVNNWGRGENPLAFITSNYNFKSNISPAGEYDIEVLEGRLLAGLINTFGEELACAEPTLEHGLCIEADFRSPAAGFPALKLKSGGWLVNIANTGDRQGRVHIIGENIDFSVEIEAMKAPFFPVGIPLDRWRVKGAIVWASAEIAHIFEENNTTKIIMYSDVNGTAVFNIPEAVSECGSPVTGGMAVVSGAGSSLLLAQGERRIQISLLSREAAARYRPGKKFWQENVPSLRKSTEFKGEISISGNAEIWLEKRENAAIRPLEDHKLWRGFGRYDIKSRPGSDILLKGAGDIISAYAGERYIDTRYSACQWQLYSGNKTGLWSFRTEIWGHSNFDDSRLPGLRLKSKKGIEAAFEVVKYQNISSGWAFDYLEGTPEEALKKPLSGFEPLLQLNSWNTTRIPVYAVYRKRISLDPSCDSLILHFEGNSATASVYVDGNYAANINRLDPYIDLSDFISTGAEAELAVIAVKRDWNEPVGTPKLIHCRRIAECTLWLLPGDRFNEAVDIETQPVLLPVQLAPGEARVLDFNLDGMERGCAYGKLEGNDVKITVLFNGYLTGRLFTEGSNRPTLTGGDPSRFYLPGPWYKSSGNRLRLLVEAVGPNPAVNGLVLEYIL